MKRVLIMGVSGYGKWVLHMLRDGKTKPIAFIDNKAYKLQEAYPEEKFFGLPCLHPNELSTLDYDAIILSVPEYFQEMRAQLKALGVEDSKIIEFDMANPLFYQDTRIANALHCLSIVKERNIPGDMAEVGVYRGEFAVHLNRVFPKKKLYLFDTFEGFREEEVKNFNNIWGLNFSETTVQNVLNSMPCKESCVIVQGYFPDSIPANISEEFCFVSLDADLYNPIYEGLCYFYPRLARGGYIFVHDYGTYYWPGTKKAVDQFCTENNISFVPLFDRCLSIVLTKH